MIELAAGDALEDVEHPRPEALVLVYDARPVRLVIGRTGNLLGPSGELSAGVPGHAVRPSGAGRHLCVCVERDVRLHLWLVQIDHEVGLDVVGVETMEPRRDIPVPATLPAADG